MLKHISIENLFSAPYSCMNRGEGGEIKSTIFGGYGRVRISGQCHKRHDRIGTQLVLQGQPAAIRTTDLLSEMEKFWDKPPADIAQEDRKGINTFLIKSTIFESKKKKGEGKGKKRDVDSDVEPSDDKNDTSAIAYLGFPEIQAIAKALSTPEAWSLVAKAETDKVKQIVAEAIASAPRDFDCAINGRMFTGLPNESIDSAVRYAHTISVNAAEEEFDYFTVKNEAPGNGQGAGFLNESSASSPTFYKFCTINVEQLQENLTKNGSQPSKEELATIVCAYIKAAVLTLPNAKQTTMFGKTLPHYVRIAVYNNSDVYSMAECFLKPVSHINPDNRSMEEEAIHRLKEGYVKFEKFGVVPDIVFEIEPGSKTTLPAILEAIKAEICK